MMLKIPEAFMRVRYDDDRHPQSTEFDFSKGANCQLFAYALLKHFGVNVPLLRSSQLWEDTERTDVVQDFEPLDLLLFNDKDTSWGAHMAVYLGDGQLIHLSKSAGLPEICRLSEILDRPKYKRLIGAKRVRTA